VPSPQDEASRQLMHDRGQLQKEVLQHRDRMRKLLVTLGCWDEVDHRAFANRLHGELVEFGVFLPQGIDAFRAHFVEALEDGATELNGIARTALLRGWEHLQALDQQIAWCDAQVATHVKHDNNAQRVMAVIGIGPLTASAAVATVGDAHLFKNGRQFADWLGTVPKQASSGGKTRLGRVTKQGNTYLRTLLFQGARSAVTSAHRRTDRLSRWIVQLQARVGWYRTLVATFLPGDKPVPGFRLEINPYSGFRIVGRVKFP
jgi:transposase